MRARERSARKLGRSSAAVVGSRCRRPESSPCDSEAYVTDSESSHLWGPPPSDVARCLPLPPSPCLPRSCCESNHLRSSSSLPSPSDLSLR